MSIEAATSVSCIVGFTPMHEIPRHIPMELIVMVRYLLPNSTEMRQKHHPADTDALMYWMERKGRIIETKN